MALILLLLMGSLVALGMRDVSDLKNVGANDYVKRTRVPTLCKNLRRPIIERYCHGWQISEVQQGLR